MKEKIIYHITEALKTLGIEHADFDVEHPNNRATHGDFSTNVALVCSKSKGKNPRYFAEEIVAELRGRISYIEKLEIAGPGFINFHLARDFFAQQIERIISNGDVRGSSTEGAGEVILFEYTSPNLFKPLHVGNLVGNIIGEAVSRLLENTGATVHRINYPSDIGLTVAKGVWGLLETSGDPNNIQALGEAYRYGNEKYENDTKAKTAIEEVNRSLYSGADQKLQELRAKGIATSRARLFDLCRMLGTKFDIEIFESEASPIGKSIVQKNIGNVFAESAGAVVFEGEQLGLHTRVFLNSQGLPTYEAKDIGNFALKQQKYPDWTQSFVVTGSEQTEYFKVIHATIRKLFPNLSGKILEHIPTGFLTLNTGKMSSRKGNVLSGESLIDEVRQSALSRAKETRVENIEELATQIAVAALKYQILRQKPGSDIIFDKQRALSFEGDSGPYLQYTHARIVSVLEKAKNAGIIPSTQHLPDTQYDIEHILCLFPEVVAIATRERAPHKIVGYLTELAGSFNAFYAQEKIVDKDDKFTPYKVAIAKTTRMTLKNGLYLLGIFAPDKM